MIKVLYNGEYIELEDEIEKGSKELDMLIDEDDLEETQEFNIDLDFEAPHFCGSMGIRCL